MGMRERELAFSVPKEKFKITTFSAGGPGGQHQNTSNTAVRITHPDSGASEESREFRSQHQNKMAAFRKVVASGKFRTWVNRQLMGEPAEKRVERDMNPSNLLIMGRKEDRWKIID